VVVIDINEVVVVGMSRVSGGSIGMVVVKIGLSGWSMED
jgi:hypothetical protein